MAAPSLADYPEVPGFEAELLEVSKAMLKHPSRNRQELYKDLAMYYAAKSGLTVTPSPHDPLSMMGAEQAVVFALKDAIGVYRDMLASAGRMSPAEYQELIDALADAIPQVFASQAIPPYIFEAVVRRHKQTKYTGTLYQPPVVPPDAADVDDTIAALLGLLPAGSLHENGMLGLDEASG